MKHPCDNPHHDRLDLKLTGLAFTAVECGAINLLTKKPEYCDFDCPTLHGQQEKPEPHWISDPAKIAERQKELVQAKVQASTELETGEQFLGVPPSAAAELLK